MFPRSKRSKHVAGLKKSHRALYVPLKHPPGEAQFDFGFAHAKLGGVLTKIAFAELLESFEFKAQPSLNKMLVNELMRGVYLANHESIILIGQPGTGKTHIATAFGIKACQLGKNVKFYRVTDLITKMIEARDEQNLERLKRELASLDLLILDELGYVPASKLGSERKLTQKSEKNKNDHPVKIVPDSFGINGIGDFVKNVNQRSELNELQFIGTSMRKAICVVGIKQNMANANVILKTG